MATEYSKIKYSVAILSRKYTTRISPVMIFHMHGDQNDKILYILKSYALT